MKKKISFIFLTYALALTGEIPSSLDSFVDKEKLQLIFEKDGLNANDMLDMHAAKTLEENNSSLTPDQLIQQFQALASTPEFQQKYLSIYASYFEPEEIQQICELLQNEVYLNYRQKIAAANFECYLGNMKILQELAQKETYYNTATHKHHHILHLNRENIHELISSTKPLVIDVYTDWCGPCKHLAPIIEELDQEYNDLYRFVKLNAEQETDLAKFFKVRRFPTILLIKDGKEVGRLHGFMNKEKLIAKIKHHFD